MASYIALIRKEPGTCYGVDFPDFPGCISGGATLDDAVRSAAQALDLHARGMLEDCERIPTPTSLDSILADPNNHGAVPTFVEIAIPCELAATLPVASDSPSTEQMKLASIG